MGNKYVLAAVGAVVGLIIGVLIGGGISENRVREAVADAMSGTQSVANEAAERSSAAMSALGERIGALEAAVGESAGASADSGSAMAALEERLAALESAISETAGTASSSAEELKAQLAELGQSLEERLSRTAERLAAIGSGDTGGSADGSAAESAAGSQAESAAASEGGDTSLPEGLTSGHTALLADGALRVFVSRVDDEGGTARLSVNGDLQTLSEGETVSVSTDDGSCAVTVDAIDRGHVSVSGSCGEAADPDSPPEGLTAGEAAVFEDGALRVFVSSVGSGTARLAVNGVEVVEVSTGESMEVEMPDGGACTVTVTTVDRGHVAVEGSCG